MIVATTSLEREQKVLGRITLRGQIRTSDGFFFYLDSKQLMIRGKHDGSLCSIKKHVSINPPRARLSDHRPMPGTVMESPVQSMCAGRPASSLTSRALCIIVLKTKALPAVGQSIVRDLLLSFLLPFIFSVSSLWSM